MVQVLILLQVAVQYIFPTVLTGGNDYFVDQTFTVLGTSLAGATPTNDLTITISGVDASGAITSVS